MEKRSSERCGVLLSGGLDSSAVAVVAARTTRPTLLTISHPGLPQVDEVSYAQAIADVTGIPLTALEIDPDSWDPADDIQMFGAPPLSVPAGMYGRGLQALAAAGCDVALDGHDGDGILGTLYAWSANTLLDGRLDRLARAAHEDGSRFILGKMAKDFVPPAVWSRLGRRQVSPGVRASFLRYFGRDCSPPRRGESLAVAQKRLGARAAPSAAPADDPVLRGV